MIFHASIPADNPERVAQVLGELLGGSSFPFHSWPNGYMARGGPADEHHTSIEVYPRDRPAVPGAGAAMVQVGHDENPSRYGCFHLAVGTPLSQAQVLAIAEREGWMAKYISRHGAFDVIEFWVENSTMIEFLTPKMQDMYRNLTKGSRNHSSVGQPPAAA